MEQMWIAFSYSVFSIEAKNGEHAVIGLRRISDEVDPAPSRVLKVLTDNVSACERRGKLWHCSLGSHSLHEPRGDVFPFRFHAKNVCQDL